MSHLFKMIAEYRLQVNMMQNTAICFSICVNDIDDKVEQFSAAINDQFKVDRKSTRLNSSHMSESRMPSSAWKKKK